MGWQNVISNIAKLLNKARPSETNIQTALFDQSSLRSFFIAFDKFPKPFHLIAQGNHFANYH